MSFTTIRAYTSNSSLFDVDLHVRGLFSSATGTACRIVENSLAWTDAVIEILTYDDDLLAEYITPSGVDQKL